MVNIPFSVDWICSKCCDYIFETDFKRSNYKKIRSNIQKICTFAFFSLPIKNILILKNYYTKNNTLICIKPLFGNKIIVFEKKKKKTRMTVESKRTNVFLEFKKRRKK